MLSRMEDARREAAGEPDSPVRGIALEICPFLTAASGEWRLTVPTRDHRCGAFAPLTPLALDKQRRLCLTKEHRACATYAASLAARQERIGIAEAPDRAGRWGIGRTAPVIDDAGGVKGRVVGAVMDRRSWPAIPALLLVATVLAVGISGMRGDGTASALSSPMPPAPIASGLAVASAAPRSTPVPTVAPTAAATVAPTIAPTIRPTTPPTYPTYTVKSGDTLSEIASKYGTTVGAIADLNGITDPARLKIGQVLKIP
jgi:LysM repeat protein